MYMLRLVGAVLSYGAAVCLGVLLTLIVTVVLPARSSPVQVSAHAVAVSDALTPFRTAGLAASSAEPITVDTPCYLPELPPVQAVQFTAALPADRFCLFRIPDTDTRDRVWQLFSTRKGARVTVHGGALLVYLGTSPTLAYPYETIFATMP